MPKKLTKLKIHEVSAVDSGAGRGVRIMLAKRVTGFDAAGEMLINGVPRWRRKTVADDGDSLAKALKEIELNKRTVAKAAAPVLEDHNMHTETVDVAKAAQAIVKRFDDLVDELATKHTITKGAALLKASTSPDHGAAWRSYREAQQVIGAQVRAVPEPEAVAVSHAFLKLQRKAEKRAAKNGTRVASEFSKLYTERPDLAAEDKAYFLRKARGSP